MTETDIDVTTSTIEKFVQVYGPFGFGIVALLIIWMAIMAPELKQSRLDFETHRKLLEAHAQQNLQSESTARTLRDTALIMERVAQTLEKMRKNVSEQE